MKIPLSAKATKAWFYSDTHLLAKVLQIFVKGDWIVFGPFLFITGVVMIVSLRLGLLILGAFLAVRGLGEMTYWLLQQFSDHSYRPYDYGFHHLDNKAIYIIYQTFAQVMIIAGFVIIFLVY